MKTAEQEAREILVRMEYLDARDLSAGEVVEIANLIAERDRLRESIAQHPSPPTFDFDVGNTEYTDIGLGLYAMQQGRGDVVISDQSAGGGTVEYDDESGRAFIRGFLSLDQLQHIVHFCRWYNTASAADWGG